MYMCMHVYVCTYVCKLYACTMYIQLKRLTQTIASGINCEKASLSHIPVYDNTLIVMCSSLRKDQKVVTGLTKWTIL
jgi:hypothetical protein